LHATPSIAGAGNGLAEVVIANPASSNAVVILFRSADAGRLVSANVFCDRGGRHRSRVRAVRHKSVAPPIEGWRRSDRAG
jgi:hypothetical protein